MTPSATALSRLHPNTFRDVSLLRCSCRELHVFSLTCPSFPATRCSLMAAGCCQSAPTSPTTPLPSLTYPWLLGHGGSLACCPKLPSVHLKGAWGLSLPLTNESCVRNCEKGRSMTQSLSNERKRRVWRVQNKPGFSLGIAAREGQTSAIKQAV